MTPRSFIFPIVSIFALASLATGSAQAQRELPRKLAAMTPAEVSARSRVTDDPLERYVIISTETAYRGSRPIDGGLEAQAHLRAKIDRSTGVTRFQVWQATQYHGARKQLYQVNYRSRAGLMEADLSMAAHEPDDCPGVDMSGSCVLAKTAVFDLSEALVREIATLYRPGSREAWSFRLKDRNGKDITGGIAPAEASGLLRALEQWQKRQEPHGRDS